MGRVDGKVALISGGAQGMGAEDARALIAEQAAEIGTAVTSSNSDYMSTEKANAGRWG